MLRYLSSSANLLGCALALLTVLITAVTGLTGGAWPLAVLGAYGLGAGLGRITFGAGPVDQPPRALPRRAAD